MKPVINIEDIENLALNPKVNHFACVKNTKQTKKDTTHWKRNIPVGESSDLQGNFLSNNHQPYITEKYAVMEASRFVFQQIFNWSNFNFFIFLDVYNALMLLVKRVAQHKLISKHLLE